jgi:hypothetical protein
MSSRQTLLMVWNRALDHLVEHALTRPDQDNAFARWFRRNNDLTRDAFLRAYPWNFAVQLNALTPTDVTPPFRWKYQYERPSDTLRFLPPTEDGNRDSRVIDYEIAGNYLYCDQSTLKIRTIQRVDDYQDWDPIAIEALALKFAHDACNRFTAKATYKDRLKQDFTDVILQASRADLIENTADPVEQHDVLDARYE